MLKYMTAADASEEALYRLPTSAPCMNLLKLPPYGRFVTALYTLCCIFLPSVSILSNALCISSDFIGPKLQGSIKLQMKSYIAVLLGSGGMSLMAKWA
ncbi:hypothetical protein IFM89_026890 [Coptis chinensis]|uniref:Uncharacterized protein n=1 Tax=Coptis chinensis TaxID=261450 RepID=A0A835LFX2_9MAGN|nr:hypothetical protein IFM89_026890 [Coptis chinensis]